MIKSGKVKWLGDAACRVHVKNASKVIEKVKGRYHMGLVYMEEYY
jgi:hypothetical protein